MKYTGWNKGVRDCLSFCLFVCLWLYVISYAFKLLCISKWIEELKLFFILQLQEKKKQLFCKQKVVLFQPQSVSISSGSSVLPALYLD